MTLFYCCSFSLRHCRVGLPKPDVVNSCTMNSPIVFVELHLMCALTLQSPTPLQPYSQQQKKPLFSKSVFRKPLMTLLSELVIIDFDWWRTTAIQHWLDYVTKSEVDITAFTHWLDHVTKSEVDITAFSTSLRRASLSFC